jgi:nucleoside-diphosphate-sugar epimerase
MAARAANVPRIIYISSISAFDGCRALYGKAKLEIEKIALANGALVIRSGLVYGGVAGGMFGKLSEKLTKSAMLPIVGSGSQVQYLVHSEDLSAFIEQYAFGNIEIPARILTAANEKPWPFKQLVIEIANAKGKKPTLIPVPWRLVWVVLKTAETCGLKLNFRSDNLISFIYQNRAPDFSANARFGLVCRPFDVQSLKS